MGCGINLGAWSLKDECLGRKKGGSNKRHHQDALWEVEDAGGFLS